MNLVKKTSPQKLAIAVSVFFFWGFVAASNGIFIPFCKTHFNLTQLQSQLIDTAYYGAYFYGALIIYIISYFTGKDVVNRLGYKNTIVLGIGLSIIGSLMLYTFAGLESPSFNLILLAFFIIALGFSLQQTGAQPFLATMGSEETGSHRLNFGGSLNSFGTLLGPLVVSTILFKGAQHVDMSQVSVQLIQKLYLFLSGLFLCIGALLYFTKFEKLTFVESVEKNSKGLVILLIIALLVPFIIFVEELSTMTGISKPTLLIVTALMMLSLVVFGYLQSQKNASGWGAIQYPQLTLGMVGIFVYVGIEVTIQSNMGNYLKSTMHLDESAISNYVSLYWGSLMIGRWVGALSIFNLSKQTQKILYYVVSLVAFAFITIVNFIKGNDISEFGFYIPFILLIITFLILADSRPDKSLLILSIIGAACMLIAMFMPNKIGVLALAASGLCCSIMWPCMFSMAIAGLKQYTSEGSALLVMMILGGAVIPPLQGAICDSPIQIFGISASQLSYIVPTIGFIYCAVHGYLSGIILKKQGVDFSATKSGGGH